MPKDINRLTDDDEEQQPIQSNTEEPVVDEELSDEAELDPDFEEAMLYESNDDDDD